jgi:glycopeptide antibiotics resistance protein
MMAASYVRAMWRRAGGNGDRTTVNHTGKTAASVRHARIRLLLWTAFIAFATVPWQDVQTHSHWSRVQWIPFVTPPVKLGDVLLNLAFYAPFGYWFARQSGGNRPWARAVWYALALSLITEWTQLYSHSRFTSLTDTTCNVLGTLLGSRIAARTAARRLTPSIEGGIS